MPIAKFEMPDGRIARFEVPEGTTPEQAQSMIQQQIEQSPDMFGGDQAEPPARTTQDPQQEPMGGVGGLALEGMAAVNRGATQLADFFTTTPANAVLEAVGSDRRVPTITGATAAGTRGNFMEDGLAKDVTRTGGEMVAPGAATGALMRGAAQTLPQMGRASESLGRGTLRQMGASTVAQDVGFSAASGAGGVLGREADEAMGGSGKVGEAVGAFALPASILGAAALARAPRRKAQEIGRRLAAGDTDRDLARYTLAPDEPRALGSGGAGRRPSPVDADEDLAKYTLSPDNPRTQSPIYQKVTQDMAQGNADEGLMTAISSGAPKIQKDKNAVEAIKQGFDDGVVAAIKGTTDANKAKMREMVKISRKGKKNATYSASNRPWDVVGDSLAQRVRFVKKVNQEAGKKLDDVARKLKGDKANFERPKAGFMSQLDDMGIKVNDQDGLDFVGSDIEGVAGAERAIKQIYARVGRKNMDDAYEMHRLKRFIDEQVTYGKATEGLSGRAERAIKSLRAGIDESLDDTFPVYDQANTQYAESIGALNAFQDSAGGKVNLFGENSGKALGTSSRRLLSNAQSRVNMMDAMKQLDDVGIKYGADFEDDIMTQAIFADELDAIFGPSARTSLAGEQAKGTRKGLEMATGRRGMIDFAIDVGEKGVEKVRGINEENAFESIMKLLSGGSQ